ncbi:hypothetical protein ACFL1L_04100 [Thermoplasmatota archaeon]
MNKKIVNLFFILIISIIINLSTIGISDNNDNIVIESLDIPDDFEMLIYCGGFNTWDPIYILYITSEGESDYYVLDSENRTSGEYSLVSSFIFTTDEMDDIWSSIISNDFFNFDNYYTKENVIDGSFANITLIANGETHSVQKENFEFDGFDNIVKNINSLTPDDNDLYYNSLFNHVPFKPDKPTGEMIGDINNLYSYTSHGYDIDDDDLYFIFDWGDETNSDLHGPYESNENITLEHSWIEKGEYNIRVKVIDDPNNDGDLSDGNESE